jgi:hypothetical protein
MRKVDSSDTRKAGGTAKYGLLQIVRVRFRAFEEKFGRLPKPDEPIFFDESLTHPVKASTGEIRAQLERGAREARVDIDPVLQFLRLSCRVKSIRSAADANARRGSARSVQPYRSDRRDLDASTGGNGFLTNERLRRRHRITREELQTLSATSFLADATERDYLLVLETIRRRPD